MSLDPSAFTGGFHRHAVTPVHMGDGYLSPIEPTSFPVYGPSIPRMVQPIQPRSTGHSPRRPHHMHNPTVEGPEPLSDLVYGFRPEAGWPGILFQVILRGAFLGDGLKYTQLAFWISFGGNEVPAIRHEMESQYTLPDLGRKRCVLQCLVPEGQYYENIIAVSMTAYGVGGKTVIKDVFIGFFQLVPNDGSIQTHSFPKHDNMLIKWLRETCPKDVDFLPNIVPSEHLQRPGSSDGVTGPGKQDPVTMIKQKDEELFPFASSQGLTTQTHTPQIHPDEIFFSQFSPQWLAGHPPQPVMNQAKQENEMMQYIHIPEEKSLANLESRPNLTGYNTNLLPLNREPHLYIEGDMSQSRLSQPLIPRRRANTSRIGRSRNGYGKITFINKPDTLGNFNAWTPQERQENRRIVVFTKVVRGDTIHLDCSYVLPKDYKSHMITISCIHWAPGPPNEKQHKFAGQCFYTSVDIILLIEKLVDHNFHVQEKNRIRRNLEGYSPETVKKEGLTHHFFNQIMLYTNPKTRNIEKDIKVFSWDTIAKAMRKIVQKYNANGGISIGRPIPATRGMEPVQFSGPASQPSSSESLPTQNSFVVDGQNAHHAPLPTERSVPPPQPRPDYPYPYAFEMGRTSAIFGTHEETGESPNNSISPQSQVSRVILPMGFPEEEDSVGNGRGQQQAFEMYLAEDSSNVLN